MSGKVNQLSSSKCFDGYQNVYTHFSDTLDCEMKFSVYKPPDASESNRVPVIYFLSGKLIIITICLINHVYLDNQINLTFLINAM